MGVASRCGEQEVGVASGSGWNLWVWLLGVVVRRYIDFLILLIPNPLVSVLFYSSIPTFFNFFMFFVLVPVLFVITFSKISTVLICNGQSPYCLLCPHSSDLSSQQLSKECPVPYLGCSISIENECDDFTLNRTSRFLRSPPKISDHIKQHSREFRNTRNVNSSEIICENSCRDNINVPHNTLPSLTVILDVTGDSLTVADLENEKGWFQFIVALARRKIFVSHAHFGSREDTYLSHDSASKLPLTLSARDAYI